MSNLKTRGTAYYYTSLRPYTTQRFSYYGPEVTGFLSHEGNIFC